MSEGFIEIESDANNSSTGSESDEQRQKCCICFSLFTSSMPKTVLTCQHEVHGWCVVDWWEEHGETPCSCPKCRTIIPAKDINACYDSTKVYRAVSTVFESSKRTKQMQTNSAAGLLKDKKNATKPRSSGRFARNKTNASQNKTRGRKDAKGFEEESLYYPEWDVHATDHPSDPLVARNLAEGIILPNVAADIGAMRTDVLHKKTNAYNVMALNFTTASQRRDAEEKAAMGREIKDLKEQLETARADANAIKVAMIELAEAQVRNIEDAVGKVAEAILSAKGIFNAIKQQTSKE